MMLNGNGVIEERFCQALNVVLTGLDGREEMTKDDIDGLRRELQALVGEGRVRFTSEEQLKAESVIAYTFRPTVEACLELWFGKSEQTDTDIWRQFGEDVALASEGTYDHWALNPEHPRMLLALIMLLDQFRRNMYRNTAAMYATDQRCLSLVKRAIKHGVIGKLRLIERVFPCLVLTHSELLADQHLCMQEWEKVELELSPTDPLMVFHEVFHRHLSVIERFGRFPHRNALLGRGSTPEEEAFLSNAEFRFDLPLVKRPDGSFCFQGTIEGRNVERVEGETVSLAYQGPDVAMAQAEQEIRLQGYARVGGIKLRKFIVERDMPAVGTRKYWQLKADVDRANKALGELWPRLTWVESYICNNKAYCVYLADSAETLRKHALLADMPMESAHEVRRIIDPAIFEHED
jgi:uncharacterized protein (DUF924 family)